jgi:glyoxylase-like metal-dependent hydrolase (beta-lactamase superfamily II)
MPFTEVAPDIFRWSDTCNVWVIRAADAAILIDLGDGSVLDALPQLGVEQVEWVLFTHHHREQCQGHERLLAWAAPRQPVKIAAPAAERELFEKPLAFRQLVPQLSDRFTVHGASYVRPPIRPIPVDRAFAKLDSFTWRGREIWCAETAGNSPGGMTYLMRRDPAGPAAAGWLAFSGDLMLDGATLHTWFDSEWDYGFCKGLYAAATAAAYLEGFAPLTLLPAHGPPIRAAAPQLAAFQRKLRRLERVLKRGWEVFTFAGCDQDRVSRPTAVPHLWQVTPHLYKVRGHEYWVNFHMLVADDGHALLVDCGLFDRGHLDRVLDGARDRLGIKAIDAILVTHMHGDHFLDAEHVRRTRGCEIWTHERVVDLIERPLDYDYDALIPAYRERPTGDLRSLKVDRVISDGEVIRWRGYLLACDWMPGQTEFACCLHGEIDGRRVAFTGDNIFGSPADRAQHGHEAVVARNSCTVEDGYGYAGRYLHGIAPDLILGGHSWAIENPAPLIERYMAASDELREAIRDLTTERDYRLWFDPYWVRVHPYRVPVPAGGRREATLVARNFLEVPTVYEIRLVCPPGIEVAPALATLRVQPGETKTLPLVVSAAGDAAAGLALAAIDITQDGVRRGQLFDVIVAVGDPAEN